MSEETKSPESQKPAESPAPQQRTPIEMIESTSPTTYANFCRVTGTPEELIIDLGLNSQQSSSTSEPIESDQRIVVNYYTAKRLMHALHMAIQRHEKVFGVVETDIQKRLKGK